MFRGGFLQAGKIGKVPLRLHWTIPLGLFVLTGFHFDSVEWLCLAGLFLIHELGHALVVRWMGATPTALEITGFGGTCQWQGRVTPVGSAAIAWGGIWAQLIVFAAADAAMRLGVPMDHRLWWSATHSNAYLLALNLLPVSTLDGVKAWPLPRLLGQMARARLTKFKDPVHDLPEDEGSETSAQARALASQLLDDAKKEQT